MTGDKGLIDREMKFTLTLSGRVEAGVRAGSCSLSWMTLFNPNEYFLKVSCCNLYYKCIKKGGPSWGYLEDIEGS